VFSVEALDAYIAAKKHSHNTAEEVSALMANRTDHRDIIFTGPGSSRSRSRRVWIEDTTCTKFVVHLSCTYSCSNKTQDQDLAIEKDLKAATREHR